MIAPSSSSSTTLRDVARTTDARTGRRFFTRGHQVERWIEKHCVFTNGRWLGKPFVLQRWQRELLYELFEINEQTGRRRYRRALIGTPRKQGKTELAAALANYLAFGDGEPAAEVYCAAASEEQADRVFDAAKRMCEQSPSLGDEVHLQVTRLALKRDPYSFIQRLSSRGRTKHGLNIHGVVLDELHAWQEGEQEELWAALTTGMAAREQPLEIAITTAGTDLELSRCGKLYRLGKRVVAGEEQDDGFLFRWWEAADGSDWRDPAVWRKCQPSFGVTVTEEFLRGELSKGEAVFRRLYLNQWIEYEKAPWVRPEEMDACQLPEFDLDARLPSWVGVDLAERRDAAAVMVGQWRTTNERPCGHAGDPCLYVRGRIWEAPLDADGTPDESWEVPHTEIRDHVRELNGKLRVQSNIFDPWHGRLMEQDLAAEGLTCERIWQTGARRAGASVALHELVADGRLHWCQPFVRQHFLAAAIYPSGPEGGYYLAKRKSTARMDAAMAAVNVVYGTQFAPAEATREATAWLI